MDKLGEALAEVARELGVKTGELYGYMTDRGFAAYAQVQATRSGMYAVIALVCAVGLAFAARCAYACNRGKSWVDRSEGADTVLGVCGIIAVIASVAFGLFATDFVLWATSPDGMVIDMVLRMAG